MGQSVNFAQHYNTSKTALTQYSFLFDTQAAKPEQALLSFRTGLFSEIKSYITRHNLSVASDFQFLSPNLVLIADKVLTVTVKADVLAENLDKVSGDALSAMKFLLRRHDRSILPVKFPLVRKVITLSYCPKLIRQIFDLIRSRHGFYRYSPFNQAKTMLKVILVKCLQRIALTSRYQLPSNKKWLQRYSSLCETW